MSNNAKRHNESKKHIDKKLDLIYTEMTKKAKELNSQINSKLIQSILDDELKYLDE